MDTNLYYEPDNWNGVLLVGEFPYKEDVKKGIALRSSHGLQLRKLLVEAGIAFNDCAVAHALEFTPFKAMVDNVILKKTAAMKDPEAEMWGDVYVTGKAADSFRNLQSLIRRKKPKFIYTFGKSGLMALHEETNVDGFRGSQLRWEGINYIPTFSMSRLNAQWKLKNLIVHDLKRGSGCNFDWTIPEYNFITFPTYDKVIETLEWLLVKAKEGAHLSVDIETRWARHISYVGIAWSKHDAICIPIIKPRDLGNYWTNEELLEIVWLLKQVLEEKAVRVSGQNYHYDASFFARNYGIRSHIWCDTMVAFHSFFASDITKGLGTLSSLFCDYHVYWKDESDNHEPTIEGESKYQVYNCKDCCHTWEIAENLMAPDGLVNQNPDAWDFQYSMWNPLFNIMLRGTQADQETRKQIRIETRDKIRQVTEAIVYFTKEVFNPPAKHFPANTRSAKVIADKKRYQEKYGGWWGSPAKCNEFFYDLMGVDPVTKRDPKTGRYGRTTDDDALKVVQEREPIVAVVAELISLYRSLCKFLDAVNATVSVDGRYRSGYKLTGTSTYRLASGSDPFDEGLNLQNISKGDG